MIISFFIPKSNKFVIIGGWFGERFADNSRYLFLYLNEYKKELGLKKVIWVTNNKTILCKLKNNGFIVYKKWDIRCIYYHLRSKFHFIDHSHDDINPFFSIRSKRINLWHGIPLKKIGTYANSNKEDRNNYIRKLKNVLRKYPVFSKGLWEDSYLLATSDYSAKIIGQAFNKSRDKILLANYPRNDVLLTNYDFFALDEERETLSLLSELRTDGFKILFYLPTFRDKCETIFLGIKKTDEIVDFHKFLTENKLFLITKSHFIKDFYQARIISNILSGNIINLPSAIDIYIFLRYSDLLITDYSSVYFDYLLLDRPIVFYPYDLEYFRQYDRGLIFNYFDITPGDKAFDINQLKTAILNNIQKADRYQKERRSLKEKLFDLKYSPGSKFIIDQLNNLINK